MQQILTQIKHHGSTIFYVTLGFIIGWVLLSSVKLMQVSGISMQPNLENQQQILVFPWAHINRNSVIVFNAYGEDPNADNKQDYYVKRVIGLPGDTIKFENHTLYVNNQAIKESYIDANQQHNGTIAQNNTNWDLTSLSKNWAKNHNSTVVPKGAYFVLGDHRSVSNDSRYWGFVSKSHVIGVVHTLPWGNQKANQNINATSPSIN